MRGNNVWFSENNKQILPKLSLLPLLIWSTVTFTEIYVADTLGMCEEALGIREERITICGSADTQTDHDQSPNIWLYFPRISVLYVRIEKHWTRLCQLAIQGRSQAQKFKTRMVVHGQLAEPAVCLSDLYDVFLLDIVRDTRQNLWTMIYRSQ